MLESLFNRVDRDFLYDRDYHPERVKTQFKLRPYFSSVLGWGLTRLTATLYICRYFKSLLKRLKRSVYQQTFIYSKFTIEKVEKGMKFVRLIYLFKADNRKSRKRCEISSIDTRHISFNRQRNKNCSR